MNALLDKLMQSSLDDKYNLKNKRLTETELRLMQRHWISGFRRIVELRDDVSNQTARELAEKGGHKDATLALRQAEARIAASDDEIRRADDRIAPTACRNRCGFIDRADAIMVHEVNTCPKRMMASRPRRADERRPARAHARDGARAHRHGDNLALGCCAGQLTAAQ